jgi:hypothetical protein
LLESRWHDRLTSLLWPHLRAYGMVAMNSS